MTARVRLIDVGEVGAWARSVSVPFLDPAHTEDRWTRWEEHWRPHAEIGRTWAVEDRGRFVGNACVFSRTVTVPGGPDGRCPVLPLAAVSAVGVHPTHRRRGLLRRLIGVMLSDARERGEPLAGLTASEAAIYGRFGFGAATSAADYVIDGRRSGYSVAVAPRDFDLLTPPEAAEVLPGLFERACARQPGQVDRNAATWADTFADDVEDRDGFSARSYLVCPGGFASWRSREMFEAHDSWGRVQLTDVAAETAEIEAALWRFVLDLDLVREVQAFHRPVDEPLRHRLDDPRQLRTTAVVDRLWLRILDTPGALTGRRYLGEGRLVLDVRPPPATPDAEGVDRSDPAAGRWLLEAGPDGAECRRALPSEPTDLVCGVAELSMLLGGGVRASLLAAAGRVEATRAGALPRADLVFASSTPPLSVTGF